MFAAVKRSHPRTLNTYSKIAAERDEFIPSTEIRAKESPLEKLSLQSKFSILFLEIYYESHPLNLKSVNEVGSKLYYFLNLYIAL